MTSLRSWQNIEERHVEKLDWGSGESKGQEDLGSGCLPNDNASGDVTFGWNEVNTHTPTYP